MCHPWDTCPPGERVEGAGRGISTRPGWRWVVLLPAAGMELQRRGAFAAGSWARAACSPPAAPSDATDHVTVTRGEQDPAVEVPVLWREL